MKIGTCVSLSSMEGISEKLKLLRENHFDSCQLISWNPSVWTDENAVTLKKLLTQYGVCILVRLGRSPYLGFLRRAAHPGADSAGIPADAYSEPVHGS